jgi:predicted lipoprotein with Yx(FWY)xxD motif
MRSLVGVLVAVAAVLSGCADTGSPPVGASEGPSSTTSAPTAETATPKPSTTPMPRAGTKVIVDDSDFGPMLYGADGQAIYLFDLEDTTEPQCYDDCATAWPPVLAKGRPVVGRGVIAGLLGTTRRADGSTQLTYGGHPLYFYAHEEPWQVLCHDFADYGGTWFVVQPDGDAAA